MKKILVPTDFSKASEKVTGYAVDLANALQAKITFFSAYHPIPYAPEMYLYTGGTEMDTMKKGVEKKLAKLCEKANKRTDKKCNYVLREGLGSDEILRLMDEMKPDLTVMGTHGASALVRTLFGSVTVKVARKTQFPLLIIPEKGKYSNFRKMVYTTDYHDNDIEAIKFLAKLARKFEAEIEVLHVADGDIAQQYERNDLETLEQEVRKAVRFKALTFHLEEDANIAGAIEKFVLQEKADLVAVSRAKRSVFLRVFMPSITKKMIYHTDVPLLVFNAWDAPSEDF